MLGERPDVLRCYEKNTQGHPHVKIPITQTSPTLMRPSHTVPTAVQVLPAPPAPSWPLSVAPKTSQALQTPQNTPKHPQPVNIGNFPFTTAIFNRRSSGRRPDAEDADGSFRPSVASPSWVSLFIMWKPLKLSTTPQLMQGVPRQRDLGRCRGTSSSLQSKPCPPPQT